MSPAVPIPLTASLEGPRDAPVLVLGNSLGTSRAVWDPQLAVFGGRFRLLRYELPGHGGAPAAAGPYTIADLGAGVLRLLDAHGIGRAAYCGISLGGMIGMWLAAQAGDRISALGLVCTSAYLPPADAWLDRAARARSSGMAAISEQVVGRWFTPAFAAARPDVRAEFTAELERTDPAGYAGCCEAIAAMDLRPSLPAISAPTLVIAGADDPATPPPHGAAIASGIARARLRVIRGAAHLANVAAPAEVGVALAGHLRAAGADGDR
jgi:3-oxoadipate enol-lactonase